MSEQLIEELKGKGEALLQENLDQNEEVKIKLQGDFGQGFVVTNKHLYILKWGMMTGNMTGGSCIAFDFSNITGINYRKSLINGIVEILTPSTQNTQKSYWGSGDKNALKSENVVTISRDKYKIFEQAVKLARKIISKQKNQPANSDQHGLEELEKLAKLKEKGILTEKEFQEKKKQILNNR